MGAVCCCEADSGQPLSADIVDTAQASPAVLAPVAHEDFLFGETDEFAKNPEDYGAVPATAFTKRDGLDTDNVPDESTKQVDYTVAAQEFSNKEFKEDCGVPTPSFSTDASVLCAVSDDWKVKLKEADPQVFELTLVNDSGKTLGWSLAHGHGEDFLTVVDMKAKGLIPDWNKKHPTDEQVHAGDQVLAVNDIRILPESEQEVITEVVIKACLAPSLNLLLRRETP
mmetsp:Transcript_43256/g.78727  ORF Transcript_43256/g.78727 Transcript_43256/m.78727 type:complete len:226 (+) Transcript_43256:46-723(+)